MSQEIITDVSSFDFEPWVIFVFDHPVAKPSQDAWYWDMNRSFIVSNPQRLLEHLSCLCRDFSKIVARYSLEQINQGIWFLLSEPVHGGKYFADESVPSEVRRACIQSMFGVYSDFVAGSQVEVMENCFDMWWDFICSDFWSELKLRESSYENMNEEQKRVFDAMFETLDKILQLKDVRCIGYALHGLGHLHHPRVKNLVQKFIDQNRDEISIEGLAWVESCRDGTVM